MKTLLIDEIIDMSAKADTIVQVEIQREVGFADRFKLYVHVDGKTVLRICKLKDKQVELSNLMSTSRP